MKEITRAAVLTPAKIRHLLNVTEATSRHPEALRRLAAELEKIADEAEKHDMGRSYLTERKTVRY